MKYRVTFSYFSTYSERHETSNRTFDSLDGANRDMEANKMYDPTLEVLREVVDYRGYYWSDQFGYSVAKEFSTKAYGSTHILSGEIISMKLKLPELLILNTDKGIYLFDPEMQTWYD